MYKYLVFIASYGELETRFYDCYDTAEAIELCRNEISKGEYITAVYRVLETAEDLQIYGGLDHV